MFGLHIHRPAPSPTPSPMPPLGIEPPARDQLDLLRRLLIEMQGEVAVVSARVDSPSARAALRRAERMLGVAATELSDAQRHCVDPAIELPIRRDLALADPDAVLARIDGQVSSIGSSAMLARFGLQDVAADHAVLAHALEGRGWRYVPDRFDTPTGWWLRVEQDARQDLNR